ncbi:hypothetical protein D9M68_806380 [compost metagenome]
MPLLPLSSNLPTIWPVAGQASFIAPSATGAAEVAAAAAGVAGAGAAAAGGGTGAPAGRAWSIGWACTVAGAIGVVETPGAALTSAPGGTMRNNWPTSIWFTLDRLFQVATSR